MSYTLKSLEVISMNSKQLFNTRVKEDIGLRAYYSKYIFNSHFLLFLTITIGVFIYSLVGFIQDAEPSIWYLLIGSIVLSLSVMPSYRSLLKEADGLFLLPYESHMKTYFQGTLRYSLALNVVLMVLGVALSALLISINLSVSHIIIVILAALVIYVFNLIIYRVAINSKWNHWSVIGLLFATSVVTLFLTMMFPWLAPLIPAALIGLYIFFSKQVHTNLNWFRYINHEKDARNRYFRVVSMFANVAHMDGQYKRRRYLDKLLPNFKKDKFNKENMYEYLFYRSFMRDNDLPMIILRLIIIAAIIMIWLNIWWVSLVMGVFVIYLIVLQMNQIYSQQAYLLWPKIWPVKRSYIQESYIRYSNKLVVVLSLIIAVVFILVHLEQFYMAAILPIWGYLINRVLSKGIYKKESMLSD